jgi:hypothetical protein
MKVFHDFLGTKFTPYAYIKIKKINVRFLFVNKKDEKIQNLPKSPLPPFFCLI